MKKYIFITISLLISIHSTGLTINNDFGKTTLNGKITDKKTGEVLPGVTIYIHDLKTGTTSNSDGTYKIENLPISNVLVQVSLIGYKLIAENIDLTITTLKDFALEESIAELNEVVVTGLSQSGEKNRTSTPITTMSTLQLQQVSSTNIIDAIATLPGISQITTGAGISKPIIRGLGYNRIVVVNDGIRQEGQQWGDEHGIEIDEFSINKAEILKGPASLSYGSDAIGGVIHFISAPTLPEGNIQGNILANYQTNNGLFGISTNIAGNKKGYIWDIRYSNKTAHSYQNKYDGYVLNSGFNENNMGGIIGINKSWGYSHLHFSIYNFTPGIIQGERDSVTGKFTKNSMLNDSTSVVAIGTYKDFKSYTPLIAFQNINHYKLVLNNNFIIGNGSLKATLGWQQNQRKEYGDILTPINYGIFFLLNTINYDLRYNFPKKNNFNVSFGVNGMKQISQNKGIEFLIPEYNLFDIGEFITVSKSFSKLDISGGMRYDLRVQHSKDLFLNANNIPTTNSTSTHRFSSFDTNFSGVSGSIGATYQFSSKLFAKLNLSRGYRAPNISELGANGVHDGTSRYEIGDSKLKPENSLQSDFAFGLNTQHITAEIDLFENNINNYIFLRKLNTIANNDSLTGGFQTFKYFSSNANLIGGEISIDIHPHPLDWLHFENSFSYVQARQKNQPDSTNYLPFTPAPKLYSEIKANAKKISKNMRNAYLSIGVDNYLQQNKIYAAYKTETTTPAYTLINIGAGTDFVSKNKTILSVYCSINNLTDVAYQNHLSRLKYEAINYTTGRIGVYNMGRNFSVKILIPINIKKEK